MKYLFTTLVLAMLVACQAFAGEFATTNEAFNSEYGYSVSLYDEMRDCAPDAYYAERDAVGGCWIALDDGAGGVAIVGLFGDEANPTMEVLTTDQFDVKYQPTWEEGPYSEAELEENGEG